MRCSGRGFSDPKLKWRRAYGVGCRCVATGLRAGAACWKGPSGADLRSQGRQRPWPTGPQHLRVRQFRKASGTCPSGHMRRPRLSTWRLFLCRIGTWPPVPQAYQAPNASGARLLSAPSPASRIAYRVFMHLYGDRYTPRRASQQITKIWTQFSSRPQYPRNTSTDGGQIAHSTAQHRSARTGPPHPQ